MFHKRNNFRKKKGLIFLLTVVLRNRMQLFRLHGTMHTYHLLLLSTQTFKNRAYHSWQLVFRNPADFTPEIRRISCVKSGRFHLKSIWNLPDFTWNPYKICQISPEIRRISWMWAFAWWSSVGLSFERPKMFCGHKTPYEYHHWYSLFQTSVDSVHGFKSQGRSIITCTLLSIACNDPPSQAWIPRPRPGPNFTPWYGEATAGVTTQCHFRDDWQIWTHDLMTQTLSVHKLNKRQDLLMSRNSDSM